MGEHPLTVKAVRDGPVCALILSSNLDFSETAGFLVQAALAVGNRIERLVLDLAGVTFLDCAGVGALAMAASFAPNGCPVIIRSLSPMARRILELLDLNVESTRQTSPGPRCDSSGLHTLLAAHKPPQSEGGEPPLVIPVIAVLRVFAITGIDRVIPNFTSLDPALAQTSDRPDAHRRVDGIPDSGREQARRTARR